MSIKKITAILTAAAVTAVSLAACNDKKEKKESEDISIVEVEQTEAPTDEIVTTIPAETYPDYPISYPEIEKKRTGNLYEAEDALMTEGLVFSDEIPEKNEDNADGMAEPTRANTKPYSGDGYVTGFKNNGSSYVVFEVEAPSNQHYDLSFSITSKNAVNCRVSVNDKETATFSTKKGDEFTLITLYGVFLTKGKTKIEFRSIDGDLKLDYLKLANNTSLSTIKYNAENSLSNDDAGESAKELMSFLTENYGKYTITGQYASDETNKELELIYQTTGKYPVIRFSAMHNSGSSFDSTFKDIDACAEWHYKGGIVGLMWYWEAPSKEKPSVYTKETDFRISDAVTDIDIAKLSQEEIRGLYGEGKISEQCYGIILDLDNMAGQLMSLKNKGVPVLWRPLHEASGDWFWWGAGSVSDYKWLWNLMYTRYTEYFELDNLIWVWNGQNDKTLVDKDTFDIASLDIYLSPEKDFGSRYEQFLALQNIVGKEKLIALSECSTIPDMDMSFRDNAVWSFFGLWYGKYLHDEAGDFSDIYTAKEAFIKTYNSDGALSLDEYLKLRGGEELVPQYDETSTTAVTTAASTDTTASTVSGNETEDTETTAAVW